VGDVSAARQHYYSQMNNVFWRIVFEAGIVPRQLRPEDDSRVNDFGIGLTDVAKKVHSGNDARLDKEILRKGITPLTRKITRFAPNIVCFNGMEAYKAFKGRRAASFGLTGDKLGTSLVFVVPSTSGRVLESREFDGYTRPEWFQILADSIKRPNRPASSPHGTQRKRARLTKQPSKTLHEEIQEVLMENGNRWMTTRELADEVNRRGRYHKRNGSPVTAFQVHGRTRQYSSLFERQGSSVRLTVETLNNRNRSATVFSM
jgi:TDG/mug DNA glycosylase family protein